MASEPVPPPVRRAEAHRGRTALIDGDGEHTYADLLAASAAAARRLLRTAGASDLEEARVAYLLPPGFAWAAVQWGVWRAGGVAVPLCLSHPPPELEYVLEDTGAALAVAPPEHAGRLRPLAEARGIPLLGTGELLAADGPGGAGEEGPDDLPGVEAERRAMILYTSGTTGRPKGVVSTHANLRAQITSLVEAWGWSPEDRILHVLPLHHVHGIVNALLCALWSGAACEMLPGFDARGVWSRIEEGRATLFMGVPTMYVKLIRAWDSVPPPRRTALSRACGRMRLMVSGSAALPVPVFERWEEIAGEPLLERYGMTEIGMALSNPLHGERRPGTVGRPLPGVEARLVDDDDRPMGEPGDPAEGAPGEIEVRGEGVFREYWERPRETREAFREDGWFRTGDEAVVEDGYWRILGRKSVDIINTGGYKVSALEVEEVLLRHPEVEECAVVGAPDPEWGERVCAAVVPAGDARPELDELRRWGKERLAPYKVPTRLRRVDALPRNAMGKVTKPELEEWFAE